ncbi:hypothetical protein Rs2_21291 [Raphanus sativus]|nr:hypothetical protein Rs2_21291 [Raphanus sativus]
MMIDASNFSKRMFLKLSKDLGQEKLSSVHEDSLNSPRTALVMNLINTSRFIEPGQKNLKDSTAVNMRFRAFDQICFLVRLSRSLDPSFVGPVRHSRQHLKSGSIIGPFRIPLCHQSSHQFSILPDQSPYQPYRKSDPDFGSIRRDIQKQNMRPELSKEKEDPVQMCLTAFGTWAKPALYGS